MGGGGGGRGSLPDSFSFPCSVADDRDRPPCEVAFSA